MLLLSALSIRHPCATDVLRQAVLQLQQAHVESASLDARLLLQHVLGLTREELLADARRTLTHRQHAQFHELIERRCRREPISHLLGRREFWSLKFKVTPHTLDPRPDSETLIEAVLSRYRDRLAPLKILDLGTGTGCLLLSLLHEYPNAQGTGVDICTKALAVAKENALSLSLADRVEFIHSHWAQKVSGCYDVVISNPPYIPTDAVEQLAPEVSRFEPVLALDGGLDGLDCYRAIVAALPALLQPNGVAVLEVGAGQARDLTELVNENNLRVLAVRDDMASISRCVLVAHGSETQHEPIVKGLS